MTDLGAVLGRRMPTLAEQSASGRGARTAVPRGALSELVARDRDPIGILDEQNAQRIQDLIPLRVERMSADPFAFYRGTAAVQAADLGSGPSTGILVAGCGDAHVANFGYFASPQRTLVFDVNDFDEAAWAPWEWDVKRLVTSIVVAGQSTDRDDTVVRQAALAAVRAYARAVHAAALRPPVNRYFDHFDARDAVRSTHKTSRETIRASIRAAEKRTGARSAHKLTVMGADGRVQFRDEPPTMVHGTPEEMSRLQDNVLQYRLTASVDVRMVLAQYSVSDLVLRVVGVGSVGTVCALVALQDGQGRALILQAKQAQRSVLEQYGGAEQPAVFDEYVQEHGQGGRVVALQRIVQALSDPFLGHLRAVAGDFYVRQFHDMKGGIDITQLGDGAFRRYGEACAVVLARAHAQSPTVGEVAGYVGGGRRVADAIVEWAYRYADLSLDDYHAFVAANGARQQAQAMAAR